MEMRLNKLIILLTTFFLLFSCNNDAQSKNIKSSKIEITESKINFFDNKFFQGYLMSVDESTPADHPYYSFLDCQKEGYFAVHFVPKNNSLITFWRDNYFQENNYEYDDLKTENKIISQLLSGKKEMYNIFCIQITKKYLDNSQGCTEESINIKNESFADIFLYNSETRLWDFQRSLKINILPPFANNDFFIENFPDKFSITSNIKKTTVLKTISAEIPLQKVNGLWSSDCIKKHYRNDLIIDANLNNAQFSISDRFSMNAQLKRIDTNKYELYFTDFPPIIPLPNEMQNWENIDNNMPVGYFEIIDTSKINLTWFGFYLKKTKKLIQTVNPFSEDKSTIILNKCSE